MTNQKAYDLIREYFTRPGAELARVESGFCRYRMDDGRKCAVGCLIPDEMYSPDFEEKPVAILVEDSPAVAELLGVAAEPSDQHGGCSFLREAQYSHDRSDTVQNFIGSLDALASKFGLKVKTGVAT